MKQVKVIFEKGMGTVQKFEIIGSIKQLGAEISFNFDKFPDSALCVLEDAVVLEVKKLPNVLKVEESEW